MVGQGCEKVRERREGREKDIMRGSESRLRHVRELGQWVSPPFPRRTSTATYTQREALAPSGSANGVTVDPATACMWPVRLPCARLPRLLSVWLPCVLFESKSCSRARGVHSIFLARDGKKKRNGSNVDARIVYRGKPRGPAN